MTTRSITPPTELAVSLDRAKDTLRIDLSDTSLDASITLAIEGITAYTEHEIGRSLISQGWRLSLDAFPDALRLDHPPIASVQSIKYYDTNNALQILSPSDYLVDSVSEPGYVVPADGKAWPETYDRIHSVIVDYTAGYGASFESVPRNVQCFILARLSEMFDSSGREFKETPQSKFVDRLLDACRTYG